MPAECVDTLIIGGGQAGIAMSHQLTLRGRQHVVLERARVAERWRSERWDGLRFQFPNWSVTFPGFPLPHSNPDAFASAAEIAAFIDAFARSFAAPVRTGVAVTALRRAGEGFLAETSAGVIEARHVVVATGPYQRPDIPALLPPRDDIVQLHASAYRAPDQLPEGAVLVVGSGASGAQIAEELTRAGRQIYLSVGTHRRFPRRYRGRDLIRWWTDSGVTRTPVEKRGADQSPVVFSGAYGGHSIDFRAFVADGMVLLGRAESVDGDIMYFGDDLAAKLAHGDKAYFATLDALDVLAGTDMPDEPDARQRLADPACVTHPIRSLDLRAAGIGTVLWATGYGFDFGWIEIDVLDPTGAPIQRHGVSEVPGLYFLGLARQSALGSATLTGVGNDAALIAERITGSSRVGTE